MEPINELELFVADANALAVDDAKREALIALLKPIADTLQYHLDYADKVQVTDEAGAKHAAETRDLMLADATTAETAIREFDDGLLDRLFRAHRKGTALIARFSVLADAARIVKGKISDWQDLQKEKAEKERQRLQAIENEKTRLEQVRLLKLADSRKTEEKKEMYREQAAALVPSTIHVAAPDKFVKVQRVWRVMSVDKNLFVKAAAENVMLQGWITINEMDLARAKASNSELELPGITFKQITV